MCSCMFIKSVTSHLSSLIHYSFSFGGTGRRAFGFEIFHALHFRISTFYMYLVFAEVCFRFPRGGVYQLPTGIICVYTVSLSVYIA